MKGTAIKLAFSLMSRIPVRLPDEIEPRAWGEAVAFYPLVGLVIGAVLTGAGMGLMALGASAEVSALLILVLWVGLTGAFHLDGLADSADAWLGGYGDRARTERILKDPACGPAGAVALILVLLGKWVALAALLETGFGPALILVPVLARAAVLWLFLALPCALEEGLVSRAHAHQPRARLQWALGVSAAAALLAGIAGVAMLLAMALVTLAGARLMRARMGGFSGDFAGALVETGEIALLVVLVLLAGC